MDVMRSCYSTNAYFVADHSRVSPLRWYFCPPGAKPFPSNHSFGSLRWEDDYQKGLPVTVGEIENPRPPYSKGETPLEATGQRFCGTVFEFQTGVTLLSSPRPEYPDGFPRCCGVPPVLGGIMFGPNFCVVEVFNPCPPEVFWPCVLWGQFSFGLPGDFPNLPRTQFPMYWGNPRVPGAPGGWYARLAGGGYVYEFVTNYDSVFVYSWWKTTDPAGPAVWTPSTFSGTQTPGCFPCATQGSQFNLPPAQVANLAARTCPFQTPVSPNYCSICPTTSFAGLNLQVIVNLTNGTCPSCNNLNFGQSFNERADCDWYAPVNGPGVFVCGTNPFDAEITITSVGGGAILITAKLIDRGTGNPIVTFQGVKPDCSSTTSFSLAYVSDDGQCNGWASASVSVGW